MFDFRTYETVQSVEIEITDPKTQSPTGWFITVCGPEYDPRKAVAFDIAQRAREQAAASMMVANQPPKLRTPMQEELDKRELLIASTLGWRGNEVEFSLDAVRMLYTDPRRAWVRDQVQKAMDDVAAFTRACAPV